MDYTTSTSLFESFIYAKVWGKVWSWFGHFYVVAVKDAGHIDRTGLQN